MWIALQDLGPDRIAKIIHVPILREFHIIFLHSFLLYNEQTTEVFTLVDWNALGVRFLNWRIARKRASLNKLLDRYSNKMNQTTKSSVTPITGTFITPNPPDYEGINAIEWSTKEWTMEFKRLQSLGIDTAILQGVISEDTEKNWEIYYPISESAMHALTTATDRLQHKPKQYPNVLPAIMSAAQETGMNIHLGLFNTLYGWFGKSTPFLVEQIQAEQIAVAQDLIDLYGNHPALAGWYISPEIMYFLHGKMLKLDMNAFLKGITNILKRETPNLPIGISPGSTLPKGNPEPVIKFWHNTLTNSGVDILYPQDAIGQLVNFPDKAVKLWQFWNSIAQETGLRLWANCESFERASFNMPNPFIASSFERLHWQLTAASPYVEKIVCWECMYFLNTHGAKEGSTLEQQYKQYFN
jgi:hypothetical protein